MTEAIAMAEAPTLERNDTDLDFAQLKAVVDDLDRALAEEKAMARTLIDTIKRIDREGEILRRHAKA